MATCDNSMALLADVGMFPREMIVRRLKNNSSNSPVMRLVDDNITLTAKVLTGAMQDNIFLCDIFYCGNGNTHIWRTYSVIRHVPS